LTGEIVKEGDKIKLSDETREKLRGEVKSFFLENRGEEIGDLQADLLLDFLIDSAGPAIYNQALEDASFWFKHRMEDMESDFFTLRKED